MAADFIVGQRITTQNADAATDRTGVIASIDTTDHLRITWDDGKQDNISWSYGTARRAFKVLPEATEAAPAATAPPTTQVPTNETTQSDVRVSGVVQAEAINRAAGFIIDVPVTLSISVRGEGLTVATAKAIARKFADDIAPTEAFLNGYSGVLERDRDVTITEVSLESSREESCEVLEELEAEDADGEPIQTVSIAAIAPKRFAVVNLATDDQPQGFDTIEEARMHVAMGFLTQWEIWDGDTIVDVSK